MQFKDAIWISNTSLKLIFWKGNALIQSYFGASAHLCKVWNNAWDYKIKSYIIYTNLHRCVPPYYQVVICGSYKSYMSIFLNRTYMIDFMIFILNHLGTNPAYFFWLRTRWFMYYRKSFRSTVGWKLELWGGYKGTIKINVHLLLP